MAPEPLDWTLDELAGKFDAHLGRETGVAELLTGWVSRNGILTRFASGSEWMRSHETRLAEAFRRGDGPPGQPTKVLARRMGSQAAPRGRVLLSANVKRHDPRGHAKACLPITYARLDGPPQSFGPEPLSGQWWVDLERVAVQKKRATEALKARRDALVALMDEAQWNDTIYITSDGFTIGRTRSQRFNAKAYVELVGADRAEDLMVMAPPPKPSEGPPRYTYYLAARDEDDEIGEIDGE
jgi:hypothetical protein